ncbi:MAG: hypothetical protein ABIQ31_09290 [Ferruginibacter sp.]
MSLQLLANTELCEFLKIPVLISHYEEHKGSSNLTFISFIRMHYFNGAPHDNTDMELPFKTNSTALIISHNFSVSLPSQPFSSFNPVTVIQQQPAAFGFYSFYLPSRSQNCVFQPPRLV